MQKPTKEELFAAVIKWFGEDYVRNDMKGKVHLSDVAEWLGLGIVKQIRPYADEKGDIQVMEV